MEPNSPGCNIVMIRELSEQFGIPQTDIMLIALNRFGLCADIPDNRLRFKLRLTTHDEVFYMAVCVNTFYSPFKIDDQNRLCLENTVVGQIFDIEKDTCDATYYRRNKTELTLNSNMRSQCQGCTFCGTYNLDPEDKIDMSTEDKIATFIEGYLRANQVKDLSDLVRVTICTACFTDEMKLVEHILSVYKVFSTFGFDKRIRYIGSQIRSEEAMRLLESLPYFSLSLTVECFSNREARMRKEKASLDMAAIQDVLSRSLAHKFSTNYLYIVGLDEMDVMKNSIQTLAHSVNRLPIFQVMQNYVSAHEEQRVEAARGLTYYLQARKMIESIFEDSNLKPRSWENYRGLFYTMYQNKPLKCIRI